MGSYLVASNRFRNRAHEPGRAGLDARVVSHMRFADATSIRYDGDDAPAAVLRHRGQHRFTAVHDTVEICRNERLPLFRRRFPKWFRTDVRIRWTDRKSTRLNSSH